MPAHVRMQSATAYVGVLVHVRACEHTPRELPCPQAAPIAGRPANGRWPNRLPGTLNLPPRTPTLTNIQTNPPGGGW